MDELIIQVQIIILREPPYTFCMFYHVVYTVITLFRTWRDSLKVLKCIFFKILSIYGWVLHEHTIFFRFCDDVMTMRQSYFCFCHLI